MRILVTGSFGHLGEALVRTLRHLNHEVIGVDLVESPFTTRVESITDRGFVRSCQLFHRNHRLSCIILRTSRFFPEPDDNKAAREAFPDENLKVNEYLFRRVDLEDVVSAYLAAAERALEIGFGRYIISDR